MKKRILSLAMALILTLALAPSVLAAETMKVADWSSVSISNVVSVNEGLDFSLHNVSEAESLDIPYVNWGMGKTFYCGSPATISIDTEGRAPVIGALYETYETATTPASTLAVEEWPDDYHFITGNLILTEGKMLLLISYLMEEGDGNVTVPYYIVIGGGSAPAQPTPTPANPAPVPTTPIPTPAPSLTATPTASTVLVNGGNVAFDAYLINGNNYFKLRDIAYILNGSEKQFNVTWDGAANAIRLTSGTAYAVAGGEMEGKGEGAKTPTVTASRIIKDGAEVEFAAYLIEGNNYFRLRDIGEAFDFGVTWDGAANTIRIDTSMGYTPE